MKRIIILAAVLVLAVGGIIGITAFSDFQVTPVTSYDEMQPVTDAVPTDPMAITFSHTDTFYDKEISVSLACADENAAIYYTTDGAIPTAESKLYSEPIKIPARSKVTATTFRVVAIDGEEKTDVLTKSYITGTNVFSRFDESTLIFVLSTDPYNLYDYYYGVAVEGYMRDEYLKSDEYDGGEISYNAPANWYMGGRESERDMYVEAYTSDGTQIINQAAGGRVVGGYSRANSQKSWRLIARNEYSEGNGMFKYPFFQSATDAFGNLLDRYDRITLRDNANDREFASIRDELSMTLSRQAGFDDTQETRPAAVFLNGEYYGFAWIHEAYCNGYLEENYGGNKDNYAIVKGKEQEVEGDEPALSDYNHILELLAEDMTDDKVFEELESLVDIDNLIQYIAIQTYINNEDWPANNFAAWKYYASEGEEITSKYQDGKWRFMLFDAEYAWGLYGNGAREKTISTLLNGGHMQGTSLYMESLLQREDMIAKYVNALCDLMSGAFKPENVLAEIENLIEECDTECMYALDNGYTSEWANRGTFEDSRQQIRDFAEQRPRVIKANIKTEFDVTEDTYLVNVSGSSGAAVTMSTQKLKGAGTLYGEYYTDFSVWLDASAYDGYSFTSWVINGKEYDTARLQLSVDMADENGEISAALNLGKTAEDKPYISEVYYSGDADWIELYNPTDAAISTDNLYLSDDELNLQRWSFGKATIEPRKTLIVVCKNNKDTSALMKLQTNFNLKSGETLYLSDSEGNILSEVGIVEIDKNSSLTRSPSGIYAVDTPSQGIN